MTIEELSVRITAEAEEALEVLDQITQKLTALEGLMEQRIRLDLDGDEIQQSIAKLEEELDGLQGRLAERAAAFSALTVGDLPQGLTAVADAAGEAGEAAANAAGDLLQLKQSQQDAARQAQNYRNALKELDSRLERLGRQRTTVSAVKELGQQFGKSGQSANGMTDALRNAEKGIIDGIRSAGQISDSFRQMGDSFDQSGDTITVNAQRLYGQLGGLISWAQSAADRLQISGSVSVDTTGAIGSLNELIQVALAAQSILAGMGVASGSAAGTSGGGGGGGRRSREDDEEEAARKAEEARKEAIRLDYARIDHQRHMNEITLEQEIQLLNQLRSRHAMNAEEIMEWEERIYDVRQEIRQRDAEQLDRLSQGVQDALREKYEAMRDAELERLEESRRAWETWRDDSVRAIDDQIAALEKLQQAEEREDQDAEELRRIERLKREIAYEQDEFNRKKLEEQLTQAVESREKRLRRQEIEDQKAALEEQAALIEQKAQQELEALDREETAIEETYAKRLEDAALEAEAEKLLLDNQQQEILALLETYVPEYDLLGRSMGERLVDGFRQKAEGISQWFAQLSSQMDGVWNQMVAAAGQDTAYTAGSLGSASPASQVNITQNVNFNQPVESPGDVARRMESVNQALGEWMSQEG